MTASKNDRDDHELPDSHGDEAERPDEWAERLESGGGAGTTFGTDE
jgi:hypothetical protein